MHSGELARLAGVTVRALRHYHQVGVLAEPERRSNGYREYDVQDLIRVLRIKRLASVGIPLERMPDLLDDSGEDAGELLDELDAELAGQIDRLSRQRELIARLRDHDAAPDVPPELAPFLAVFAGTGLPPDLLRMDRDQSILLAHLAGDDGMPQLTAFYGRLSDPELAPAVAAISERFARLGPASTDQEITDLVERFATTFAGIVEDHGASDSPMDLAMNATIFSEYVTGMLNEAQRRALDEVERRFGEVGGA
ncbi:MerR family transcriptional regulator [Agromyces aerolatus]|uniref:MerR family transcriptional regulator n=1 Tax=Agromyces sp. LY-1074 TaxID=3074080 RepID=UPI0028562912|nr:MULTISPECIES: MerR family transcriptional regulator [unclassified Agromyces]MDR5700256.1 MerR family transcriptional regulator [Agromyces sp. LY-1074]MDR5706766.1 MerR family transcriptional regulator [Agromyces sp. LY-1358]